ncbi:MAG: 2-amino-4-hydroxy-6-hydroxymethyldihydropteridine diphosphokinase [Xanthomonadales bacterium]|jgi:2-amino-4-hydroxy-6-hydroxymethyldihydropteridine diphosphokinase|nr:2-amino-4-hydroxy-6-hydroxymethyldihydropteridine diphosphokinase [Xanthomonadales bacterium]MDH3924993.1 2-amino-4-hydroxy-6-hydroxymethyldihydropteridine diphosphokinase [Xanthomonadales bacterium]MDH3942202.1 2-amino-4-hydroxy-6-hydroxymethyldihydropteridine diphosphokinase [Xanthomonadales bacterium]MDH4001377.1 2-amino-4-hydroxy-6-hydroxymethyldihydropteridine diphosphokinase [Xanthomonadales bacterium]
MRTVFLGLGSNINAEKNIASAIHILRQSFRTLELSPVYRCAPHGFEAADFINLVARTETDLPPLELKTWLTELENRHQRNRNVPKFSSRTLDVDILLYGDLVLYSPELEIPREEILEAAYVLQPLAALAPDWVHPVKRKTILELWNAFPREGKQPRRIELSLD